MTTVSPQYLEGFRAAARGGGNGDESPAATPGSPAQAESPPDTDPPVPAAALSEEERIKGELHPLDAFPRVLDCAKNNHPPREDDQFRFRWFGLFYQGPGQDGFVLRLRLPGGRLRAYQLAGLAALTQELAGGHVLCNAQGGLDIPGVPVRDSVEALRRVEELGLRSLLSGGDCVRAVRGGEYEGLTDHAQLPTIYPLVRELEQALAMDRRVSDLPAGCEVIVSGFGEVPSVSDANGGMLVFQAITAPSDDPATREFGGPAFSLAVPGFGPLDLTLTAAQVVPAASELLGRWATQGNRTDRPGAGIAGFCASAGGSRLREWLTQRIGPAATAIPDARMKAASVSPPPAGVPVPDGCLLSGEMERLAEVARCHGPGEIRLAGAQLFLPRAGDNHAAAETLRDALSRA